MGRCRVAKPRSQALDPQLLRDRAWLGLRPRRDIGATRGVAVQWCRDIGNHRTTGSARRAGRGVRQRDFGQSPRFRRHSSGYDHPSRRARRCTGIGACRSEGNVRPRRADGVHPRGGGRVPHRQCGVSRSLCPWLAHHLDLRRLRCGGGMRQTAWTSCRGDRKCDRHCRKPVGGHCRKSAKRRQECQRRQRGAQRPVRSAVGGAGI